VIEVMEQRGMRTMGTVIRFELPGIQLSSEKRSQRMANSVGRTHARSLSAQFLLSLGSLSSSM